MPPSPRTRSKLLRNALLAILAFPALVFVAVILLAIPEPSTLAAPTRAAFTVIADGRVYGESERAAALQFVEEQAHRISVICRFLRGI